MIEFDEARDEIFELFNAAWTANTPGVLVYVPKVYWQGVEERDKPEGDKYWCRLSKDNVFEEQATLSNCEGIPGQKRYTASGLVFVQIFCPKQVGLAFENGQRLAKIARNAFRGKATPGKIWFRNVRINELPPEDQWYRFNVVAEFEYDELG